MATGFMMSIIVAFHLLVPKLRPLAIAGGFVTPGDYLRQRFGGRRGGAGLQLGVALLMTVALANFLFAQLKAMGLMAEQVTGGLVSYELGVLLLAARCHRDDPARAGYARTLASQPALAAAAAATQKLRVGCRVFCIDYRLPVVLAKEAATLDLLSDGRLELGLAIPGEALGDLDWTAVLDYITTR